MATEIQRLAPGPRLADREAVIIGDAGQQQKEMRALPQGVEDQAEDQEHRIAEGQREIGQEEQRQEIEEEGNRAEDHAGPLENRCRGLTWRAAGRKGKRAFPSIP